MPELPTSGHTLKYRPPSAPAGHDSYRWHVHLDDPKGEVRYLVVDLTDSQAAASGLGPDDLDAKVESALQRFAQRLQLASDRPVLEQVDEWDVPVVLRAEDFA